MDAHGLPQREPADLPLGPLLANEDLKPDPGAFLLGFNVIQIEQIVPEKVIDTYMLFIAPILIKLIFY